MMWSVWTVAKSTGRSPSDIVGVAEWATTKIGMPDLWTVYQFDHAVSFFGNTIESMLTETVGPKHTPRYRLEDLLQDNRQDSVSSFVDSVKHIKGAVRVRKKKNGVAHVSGR